MSSEKENRVLAVVLTLTMILTALFSGLTAADPPQAQSAGGLFKTITTTVQIDAGESFYIYYDPDGQTLYAEPPPSLPPECIQALSMVPDWLKVNLSYKFRMLSSDYQTIYANLIINSPDPKYTDEIAFVVAHSAVDNLQDEYFFPELITHNAQLIYANDQFLNYVQIVEKPDYTTVVYKDKNNLSVELSRELYYFYIVHPKLSDELPTYVHPNYSYVYDPPFDRNYGTPPDEGGEFWREWLFYSNDTNRPLLKDKLVTPYTVWEAISALNSWMSGSMSFDSDEERPIQPVRIYRKHKGRCGEYQDLRNAVARAALIPSTCTSNSAEDHMWNEFWDNRWIHWDGSVDNPRMYENGWGKTISSVWIFRGDSDIWSVSEKYTDVCYYTATVLDSSGMPVDGALIDVQTEFYYNESVLTTTTWGTTDYTGKVTIPLGDERNYWSSADSDSLGTDPINGVTSIITESVAWANYSHTFSLPMSAESLNVGELTPPLVVDPKYRMDVKYEVVANILEAQSAMSSAEGDFYSQSGNIDFFMSNSFNYNRYSGGLSFNAYNVEERSVSGQFDFYLPDDDRYYTVLSNEFAQATTKIVQITVDIISDMRVDIDSPSQDAEFDLDSTIYIQGTSWSPNRIDNVKVGLDDSGIWGYATDASGNEDPFTSWDYYLDTTGFMPGTHTLWSNATSAGNYSKFSITITLNDVTAPILQIEFPEENAQFVIGDKITLSGTVSDNVEIEKLDLIIDSDFNNSIDITYSIVNDVFSYEIDSNVLGFGEHSFEIFAHDTSGNFVSDSRNIKVLELEPPLVLIEHPKDGEILRLGDVIEIRGLATDNADIIAMDITIDDLCMFLLPNLNPDGSWTYLWDSQTVCSYDGVHIIEVVAKDSSDNIGSDQISVILDGTLPLGSFTTPEEGHTFKIGETITISGSASDNWELSEVQLIIDNNEIVNLIPYLKDGLWNINLDSDAIGEGEHIFTLFISDTTGHSINIDKNIRILEAISPLVSIDKPKNGFMIMQGESLEIKGSATDNKNIQKLELIIDENTPIDITANLQPDGTWAYDLNTNSLSDRFEHTVEIKATDSSENTALDSIVIIIDGEEPSVSISLSQEKDVYKAGESIELHGTASDDWRISTVTLQIDDDFATNLNGRITDEGQWEYEYKNTQRLASGKHTFTLLALDRVGHERKATLTITIDAEFPEIEIDELPNSFVIGETVTISGYADDDIEIEEIIMVIDDENEISITPSLKFGKWEYELDTNELSEGRHSISVYVTDCVNNQVVGDVRIRLIEETTEIQAEEVEGSGEEKENKIGPFEFEMFVLLLVISIMLIVALLAIRLSKGKKK
jgi:hypothetical protein